MARNVFVSYKYADENVQHLWGHNPTRARYYVDEIEKILAGEGHTYYGEHDGEDLSDWSEDAIWEELKTRIFWTSCTIILISPNMVEPHRYDKSQWIPWEIHYSLIKKTRDYRQSQRNAILAVVLPGRNGSYEYAARSNACCSSGCTTYIRDWMFTIIKENLFNLKRPTTVECQRESTIWHGEFNYIPMVRWDYFRNHLTELIERAERIKEDHKKNNSYELHLSVNK